MPKVKFIKEDICLEIESGITILEAAIRAGIHPDAPCGGMGKCGKCQVRVNGNAVLACQTKVEKDCEVETLSVKSDARILTEGFSREVAYLPDLRVAEIEITKPVTGEKKSDWERFVTDLAEKDPSLDPGTFQANLREAGALFEKRSDKAPWYAVYTSGRLLEMRKERGSVCFAAFDIGTTTVAGYLLDAATAETLAIESRMNPQAQYGADVIMRANYALENGTEVLSTCIRETINEMLGALTKKAGISRTDVFQVSIVGNTCMHHLFLGISPASLVHAPYTPALSRSLVLSARDYGLEIQRDAELIMLPDIAGYVGADTCGCLLALRQDHMDEISLMLDIGTNGEMVLGNKERLVTCSTAAGPAFEGAKIECGMRGAPGAVDHVEYKDGKWSYTTVDNRPGIGICGSGLIDLVACLCRAGLVEEGGRMHSGQENDAVFMLVPPEESGNGKGVYLTQKDIGEVQLAKAAIAAGIQLLMEELGIEEKDISRVFIAGAFGNYMNPVNAGRIGMYPASLTAKVEPVGNAAGEGAKIALLNRNERAEMDGLTSNISFIELAASADFQDCFVEELAFPESEE